MRHRIATLTLALTAVLGTGAAVAAGPAQATTPSHHTRMGRAHVGPDFTAYLLHLYLTDGKSRCVVAQGPGNQVAIKDPAGNYCARFTSSGPAYSFTLQDGSGHCLRANSASQVKIESTSCNPGDANEQWAQVTCNSNSDCLLYNNGRNAYMKTNGESSGDLVYVGFSPGYLTWYFCQPGSSGC